MEANPEHEGRLRFPKAQAISYPSSEKGLPPSLTPSPRRASCIPQLCFLLVRCMTRQLGPH